jgi:uncharacterized protein
MDITDSLTNSLLSPMVLAFVLGIISTLVKSDLKFPEGLYIGLTIYLLFGIGLKGGMKLSQVPFLEALPPIIVAISLCLLIPVWSFFILHKIGKLDISNSAAVAAHYGSVSAVTFSECISRLDILGITYEGYVPALLAIMEVPAILVAILTSRFFRSDSKINWKNLLHELFTGKGAILLLGGMVIGTVIGKKGFEQIAPLFDSPFKGVLVLFLLEVGIVTGRRMSDLKNVGFFLVGFGTILPILHGVFGIVLGKFVGLSFGGSIVLGTLAASASYIAAPAACRIALPDSNPSIYLTASLAITFPFNLILGIPLYISFAKYFYGV